APEGMGAQPLRWFAGSAGVGSSHGCRKLHYGMRWRSPRRARDRLQFGARGRSGVARLYSAADGLNAGLRASSRIALRSTPQTENAKVAMQPMPRNSLIVS